MSSSENRGVAIVTGAGTGIGLACATLLAHRGHDVALLGRRKALVDEAAAELEQSTGRRAIGVACDVSDSAAVTQAFEEVQSALGAPRVLVNNAGVLKPASVFKTTPEDFSSMVDINVGGTFNCTREAALRMREADNGGRIVNVASMLGQVSVAGFSIYGAAKAAIIQFTKISALEFAKFGVQVNAVLPGYVRTPMSDGAQEDEKLFQMIVDRIPAGRFAEPEEIAESVGYLVSPAGEYITGTSILIDGGYSLRP